MHSNGENQIGLFSAIVYVLGDIIGSGIFVSPSAILKHSQSVGLSLIIWIAGCFVAAIGCLVYVELGTKIRRSGCDFAYLTNARWRPVAVTFLYLSCCLIYPSILAIQTMAFGEYVVHGLGNSICLSAADKEWFQKLVGFMALWIVCFINLFSLNKFASRFQIVVTISKFVVIGLIVLVGFYHLIFKESSGSFKQPFSGSTKDPGQIVLGLYASLFAYNGWDILNFGCEEIKNPRRTLPISGITGICLAAIAYVAINIAYFSVLSVEEFKCTETVAVDFAQKTLGNFSYVVPFLIALLLLGTLNSTIFGCSRYVLAGSRERYFPSFLRLIHLDSESPRAAVIVEVFIAMALSFIGSLEQILSYMTFAMWCQRFIVQIALLWMRYRKFPYPKDAFVLPIIFPIIFLVVCLALLVIPVVQDYRVAIYGIIMILVGLSVYFVFIFRDQPKVFHKIDGNLKVLWITYVVLEFMVVAAQVALNLEFDDPPKIE